MKERCNFLSNELFNVDKNLGPALLEVRGLCLLSQEIRYLELNINDAYKYEDFKRLQENYRHGVADSKMDHIESSIKDLVVNNCKKSLYAFKEENRIPIKGI